MRTEAGEDDEDKDAEGEEDDEGEDETAEASEEWKVSPATPCWYCKRQKKTCVAAR